MQRKYGSQNQIINSRKLSKNDEIHENGAKVFNLFSKKMKILQLLQDPEILLLRIKFKKVLDTCSIRLIVYTRSKI